MESGLVGRVSYVRKDQYLAVGKLAVSFLMIEMLQKPDVRLTFPLIVSSLQDLSYYRDSLDPILISDLRATSNVF